MTASDYYYIELCKSFGIPPREDKQERQQKKTKPKRLAGGCLLYRLPANRNSKAHREKIA